MQRFGIPLPLGKLLILWAVVFLAITIAFAQNDSASGIPTLSTHFGGPYDQVDPATSNILLTIPVRNKNEKIPFVFNLVGNSHAHKIVTFSTPPQYFWSISSNAQMPFGLYGAAQGLGASLTSNDKTITCNGDKSDDETYGFAVIDSTGTSHPLASSYKTDVDGCDSPLPSTATTVDGSGYTVLSNRQIYDRSGNLLSGNTLTDADNVSESVATSSSQNTISYTYTDSFNTNVLSSSVNNGFNASTDTYTHLGGDGKNIVVTVTYTHFHQKTVFNCSGITDLDNNSSTVNAFPTTIKTPNGNFTISYETTPGYTPTSGYITGRIAGITYPEGGSVQYTYSGGNNGVNCSSFVVPTLKRIVNDGQGHLSTWTYVNSNNSIALGNFTVKVTDQAGNLTVYNFSGELQTQKQVNQGTSTLLLTQVTCYNKNFTNCPTATAPSNSPTQTDVFSYPNSLATGSIVETKFDAVGNVAEIKNYDFGAVTVNPPTAAPTVAPLSDTTITHANVGGVSCGSVLSYAYDRPCSVTTVNSAGSQTSGVSYTYNAGGHATQTVQWVNPSSNLTSSAAYQTNGALKSTTDVNGATTQYDQTSYVCNSLLSTSTTFPAINGTSLSTSQTWDSTCDGGVVTGRTDANKNLTGLAFSDPYWRTTSVTDPLQNVTMIKYPSATTAESSLAFGSSTADVLSTTDGLGRLISTQKMTAPSSGSYDNLVQYGYGWTSGVGAITTKTLPGASTSSMMQLDGAGRTSSVTNGAGGVTSYTYSYQDVVIAGPTSGRQIEHDGLGRITSVCELTPNASPANPACNQKTGTGTGFLTTYTYDSPATNAVTVEQNANGAAPQYRYYYYDGLGRLAKEINPETGTTSYTYDNLATNAGACTAHSSGGDLILKLDANGNGSCYVYDSLHRLLSVGQSYSTSNTSATPDRCFTYDSATVNSDAMKNVEGRLAEAYTVAQGTGCSAAKVTDEGFSYSPRGEITDVYESTPNSNGYYHTKADYFANGALNDLSGVPVTQTTTRSWTFGVDTEGRPNQATDNYASAALVNSAYFFPSASTTTVNLGSGDSDIYGYDANTGRMKSYQYSVGASGNTKYVTGTLGWNSNGTLGSLGITDGFDPANVQNCTYAYDDLARVNDATCVNGSTQVWKQDFTYDPFGNISKTGSLAFGALYTPSTNRISNLSASYDSDGNLTGITDSIAHVYSWNAYGEPSNIDGVGLTYDALGRTVEQNRSGTYQEILYSPIGKTALMTRQITQNIFLPLPGGEQATYTGSTIRFRHSDWLRTYRFESNENEQEYGDLAYAPFGEIENNTVKNTPYLGFTGQNEDTIGQNNYSAPALYDFLYREYSPNAGRWISPDPAGLKAVNFSDPQSFNRYAYVENNPLANVDPLGLMAPPGWYISAMAAFGEEGAYGGTCNLDGASTSCALVRAQIDLGAAQYQIYISATAYFANGKQQSFGMTCNIGASDGAVSCPGTSSVPSEGWNRYLTNQAIAEIIGLPSYIAVPTNTWGFSLPNLSPETAKWTGAVMKAAPDPSWGTIKAAAPRPGIAECVTNPSSGVRDAPGIAPEQPDAAPGAPPPGGNDNGQNEIDFINLTLSYTLNSIGCWMNHFGH